jgi:hypothetical protein
MENQSVDQVYKTSALMVRALILGQLVFGAVAWYMHDRGAATPSGSSLINPLTYAWFGLCLVGVIGAMVMQQRIGRLGSNPETMEKIRNRQITPLQVQTQIIIMWALLESGGLLGLVVYFLTGALPILLASLGYIVLCAVVFFPRRVWFDAFVLS